MFMVVSRRFFFFYQNEEIKVIHSENKEKELHYVTDPRGHVTTYLHYYYL